jgi:hypothetical protein
MRDVDDAAHAGRDQVLAGDAVDGVVVDDGDVGLVQALDEALRSLAELRRAGELPLLLLRPARAVARRR